MRSIPIEEAAIQLPELIKQAGQGEEIVLVESNRPVARIVAISQGRPARQPGSARGIIPHIAEDFDDTPEDFEDYIP